jgi:hypothetical protein
MSVPCVPPLLASLLAVALAEQYLREPPAAAVGFVWPEQIHMALTGRPGEAVIEWVSSAPPGTSQVELSDEVGCDDARFTAPDGSSMKCPCFPFACWRQNYTCAAPERQTEGACAAPHCAWQPVGRRCVGSLFQNVSAFEATDWFGSAMPRDPATGEPTAQAATAAQQRRWMDEPRNPAALNYTLHQALVTGLTPGEPYYYRVGFGAGGAGMVDSREGGSLDPRAGGWSDIISFTAFPPRRREPVWAVYGDMGATTDEFRGVAPSIPVLQQDQQDGLFDGVIHAGDYAYDFAPYGGRVGDRFMNLVRGA